jgi:hypothetical protein
MLSSGCFTVGSNPLGPGREPSTWHGCGPARVPPDLGRHRRRPGATVVCGRTGATASRGTAAANHSTGGTCTSCQELTSTHQSVDFASVQSWSGRMRPRFLFNTSTKIIIFLWHFTICKTCSFSCLMIFGISWICLECCGAGAPPFSLLGAEPHKLALTL